MSGEQKQKQEVVLGGLNDPNWTVVNDAKEDLTGLYPKIEPYFTGMLKVDDTHTLYYEQSGNPKGKPVIIVHGGPGGGSQPSYRQYLDPEFYRIIQFDQRGCGNSKPHACLKDNTTWHSVADMETIREKLGVDRWMVFGGSWGSTLALSYAETHPKRVVALVLRGIFTLRRKELLFFYQEGSSWIFPEAFEEYVSVIPEVERGDIMSAFYRRLTSDDEEVKLAAARAWSVWEMSTSYLTQSPEAIQRAREDDKFCIAFARIECHYFVNGGFFKRDGQLIGDAGVLEKHGIPGVIVQGRYDMVCPAKSCFDLHKQWPSSDVKVIATAGHSVKEKGITSELVKATNKFRDLKW